MPNREENTSLDGIEAGKRNVAQLLPSFPCLSFIFALFFRIIIRDRQMKYSISK